MPDGTAFSLLIDTLGCMGIQTDDLTERTHLAEDLNLDSIEFAELSATLSRRCGLQPGILNLRDMPMLTLGDVTRRLTLVTATPLEGHRA
jgi:acyl carrier protein